MSMSDPYTRQKKSQTALMASILAATFGAGISPVTQIIRNLPPMKTFNMPKVHTNSRAKERRLRQIEKGMLKLQSQ